jgi:hypothetical protein
VTGRLKAGIAELEQTFIARQRLVKQLPAQMNKNTTTEKLLFLCNGELNTSLQQ